MRFLAKGEMSYITGTITDINGVYLWLNVNDEGTKAKVFYKNILRIYETNPAIMMFKTLQRKAEQHYIRGNYKEAKAIYEQMLEISTGKEQKRICRAVIEIINEKLTIEAKN